MYTDPSDPPREFPAHDIPDVEDEEGRGGLKVDVFPEAIFSVGSDVGLDVGVGE